jgi:hypothetical protein
MDDYCTTSPGPVRNECDGEQRLPCSLVYIGNSCADAQGAMDVLRGNDEALLTLNNQSQVNRIHTVPSSYSSNTATTLLLPPVPSDTTYVARTTAIRTTCQNVTPKCNVMIYQPMHLPPTGSVGYDCSMVGSGMKSFKQGLGSYVDSALGPGAVLNITGMYCSCAVSHVT